MLKFGMKVPHIRCDSHTSFRSKDGSRSPHPLMLTHIVRHIFRTARHTNFKLGVRIEDDDSHQPQVLLPLRLKVKVARSRDQSEPSWSNAVSQRGYSMSAEPGGHTACLGVLLNTALK